MFIINCTLMHTHTNTHIHPQILSKQNFKSKRKTSSRSPATVYVFYLIFFVCLSYIHALHTCLRKYYDFIVLSSLLQHLQIIGEK